jgi:membrane-associated phospholipid phosphatase
MRVSEWVIAAFFSWTTILVAVVPTSGHMQARILLANAVIAFIYLLLSQAHQSRWVETARDWIPQALMIVAYKQMGWFAPATHTNQFEHEWIVWDRLLLDDLYLRAIIESLGPVIPSLLELSYALVYAVPPITMGIIYALGLRKRADTILTIYLLGLFLCYAQFPFWPSEPPRAVFPGQDMPNVSTAIRTFNLWLVGNYGIHTSVFPSAHVSGAVAAALGIAYVVPHRRRLVLTYFVYAILVAFATVYGRYHYAVDAAGGFIVGIFAWPLGSWLIRQAEARKEARLPGRVATAGHTDGSARA